VVFSYEPINQTGRAKAHPLCHSLGKKLNLDNIYRDGEQYYFNMGTYKNPYPPGSLEFNEFERGWTQALKRSNGSQISHSLINKTLSEPIISASENIKQQSELYRNRKG